MQAIRTVEATERVRAAKSTRVACAAGLLYLLGTGTSAATAQETRVEVAVFKDVLYLGPDGDLRPHHTIVVSRDLRGDRRHCRGGREFR